MLAAGALTAGGVVLVQQPAAAATSNLTVTTTADVPTTTGACANAATVVAPSPVSLRETVCLANNIAASTGNAVVIDVPAGTYTLAYGQLKIGTPANSNIAVSGAGAASTTISGGGVSRIFDADPNVVGGVSTTLTGLTLTGGLDNTIGGGAVIGGSQNLVTADSLTIDSSVITDNHVNTTAPSQTLINGGGVNFAGGSLTITNSILSNNSSGSSEGSAVNYRAQGHAPNERLVVSNTTFSGNTQVNNSGGTDGGALSLYAPSAAGQFSVTSSTFVNNSVNSTLGYSRGAAIITSSGTLTVTASTFVGNSATGGSQQTGGAIQLIGTASNLHYNRFYKNVATAGSGVHLAGAAAVSVTDNWWGCNGGPGSAGCDTVVNVSTSPRLVLTGSASPSTVTGPSADSTITAGLLTDSSGLPISAANLGAFANLPIAWSSPRPGDASVSPATSNLMGAQASAAYNSGTGSGPGGVTATLDKGALVIPIVVDAAPAITSADQVSFPVGVASSFTVTTTGYPTPSISLTGALPPGVTFVNRGNGTATISGTAASGSGGSYPVGLTASNSTAPAATQTLTVSVPQPPAFTSADHTTFTVGASSSFTVRASGTPAPAITSNDLPGWLTLTDNSDGSATLAGTAPPGSGGTAGFTLDAANGADPAASQAFTLTVNEAPALTSADHATFTVGVAGTFTVTTSGGYPTPPALTETGGPLPAGITFVDNGDGTATLSGTAPTTAEARSYPITVTASNGSESSNQQFTLTVDRLPVLTLPPTLPAADGHLTGVPAQSTPGQLLLDVRGSGFAPGAAITLGTYSPATVVGHTTADGSGAFHTTLQLPSAVGRYTVVAAGIAPDGTDRYLEAATEVVASPAPTTSPASTSPAPRSPAPTSQSAAPSSTSRGALAFTGAPEDPMKLLVWAAIALVAGLALLTASRRHPRRR